MYALVAQPLQSTQFMHGTRHNQASSRYPWLIVVMSHAMRFVRTHSLTHSCPDDTADSMTTENASDCHYWINRIWSIHLNGYIIFKLVTNLPQFMSFILTVMLMKLHTYKHACVHMHILWYLFFIEERYFKHKNDLHGTLNQILLITFAVE